MAWNEPGSGGKDPWGQKNSDQGPPDLDEIVRNLQKKLSGLFGGRGGGRGSKPGGAGNGTGGIGLSLILVVAIALWIASGFYIVQQGERGVVLQFGKKSEVTEAGLRWHIPWPIEHVEKVNVEKVHKIEIGYRVNERTGGKTKVPRESVMLTGDENIVDLEFAVQYRIKNADDFLFNVRDVQGTITQATESAVREVAGNRTMDFILTEGRDEVGQDTQNLLQEILDSYKTGIFITKVEMQKALPPEEVKPAFDDAVKAREDQQRFINEAQSYANDITPRARGKAARLIQEAEGYKAATIARAEGDARRFSLVAREYAKAPRVTRDRLYLDAMEQVLSNTTKIFVDQKAGNNLLYLPLDRLIQQGGASASGNQSMMNDLPPAAETGGAQVESRSRTRTDPRSRRAP